MRRKPLALALASVGFAVVGLAPAFQASVAQERPITFAQAAAPSAAPNPARRIIDDMFRDFTAEWVRSNPDLAMRTRYLTGEEQDRLERQLTPRTEAWKRSRIQLARRGLAELQTFDRASMSEDQRLSAEVLQWQLQAIVDEEPFLDHVFPLEQLQGANVALVNALVVVHPLARISHTTLCIGAPNQRKLLCENDFHRFAERPDADRV